MRAARCSVARGGSPKILATVGARDLVVTARQLTLSYAIGRQRVVAIKAHPRDVRRRVLFEGAPREKRSEVIERLRTKSAREAAHEFSEAVVLEVCDVPARVAGVRTKERPP